MVVYGKGMGGIREQNWAQGTILATELYSKWNYYSIFIL